MTSAHDAQLKAVLLDFVQSQCRGRLNGQPHRRVAEFLHCPQRRERRLVNELVLAGHRIATSSQWGVFWVVDAEDARIGRQELADKAYPVMERLRAYELACAEVLVPEQGSLWEQFPLPANNSGDVLAWMLAKKKLPSPPLTVSLSHA